MATFSQVPDIFTSPDKTKIKNKTVLSFIISSTMCIEYEISSLYNNIVLALAGMAQWIKRQPANQGSQVQFPVGAHACVVDQVPSRGRSTGNQTLMFLSLFFPPFLSL